MRSKTLDHDPFEPGQDIPTRLRWRILPLMLISLLLLQGAAYWIGADAQDRFVSEEVLKPAEDLAAHIRQHRDLTAAGLAGIGERIMADPSLVVFAKERDTEALYEALEPVLSNGDNRLGVSHLYVHDVQGNNLLRVHKPEDSGGRIERWTYKAARSSGEPRAGFEAGHFGALTLRYVTPWRDGGEVIAYLELTVELSHIIENLGEPVLAAVSKKRLDERRYREMLKRLGRVDHWDEFAEVVVPYSTSPELRAALRPELDSASAAGGSTGDQGHRLIEHEGRSLLIAAVAFEDASGEPAATLYSYRDVSAAVAFGKEFLRTETIVLGGFSLLILALGYWLTGRIERAMDANNKHLADQSERYELAIHGSRDAIFDWDIEKGTFYFGPQWQAMLSLSQPENAGTIHTLLGRVASHDLLSVESKMVEFVKSGSDMLTTEFHLVGEKGRVVAALLRAVAVRSADGHARRISGSIADISSIKSVEEEMRELLEHDQLTGLISRREFMRRLEKAIGRSGRADTKTALLFFDIDHFKVVNDSLGHVSGDDLIRSIADRVRQSSPEQATAARLGGDEFAVLLEDIPDIDFARRYASMLREACAEPHTVNCQRIEVTISAGLVSSTAVYKSSMELLRDVDTAMYEGKKRGRNCLVEFDAEMHRASMDRMDLEQDLRKALGSGEMFLAYQPIVDLESGAIVGAEALSRWNHPERGLISPVQFIAIAEDSGMIERLGDWAIESVLVQLADWRTRGVVPEGFRISVNISKRQLLNPGLPDRLTQLVMSHGLSPRDLKLEVTETTIVDNRSTVTATLSALREKSFTIMMDDFGTGHSSLSGLQNLPIDELKIDQSFVRHDELDSEVIAITSAIVTLANHLSLKTVAEGIETAEQLALLQTLGCQLGQGYFFAKPADSKAFEAWLDHERKCLAA